MHKLTIEDIYDRVSEDNPMFETPELKKFYKAFHEKIIIPLYKKDYDEGDTTEKELVDIVSGYQLEGFKAGFRICAHLMRDVMELEKYSLE